MKNPIRCSFLFVPLLIAACTGADRDEPDSDPLVPTLSLSADPDSVPAGGSSTLSWTSAHAIGCEGGGAWSGAKALDGKAATGALTSASTFALTCAGPGGSVTKSVEVKVEIKPASAPTATLTVTPDSISAGSASTLTWSSANAVACSASGAWSGAKTLSGTQSTGALASAATFILTCTGPGGTVSRTAKVAVGPHVVGVVSGLDFPSNGETSEDVRFLFTGANLIPMYPATYIWRVRLRRQSGYYTTFFWGPDGEFTGASYFGCHPYPDGEPKPSSRAHKWELSIDGMDYVNDANGHSTQLGYDVWRTQAMRVRDEGKEKVHEFFWDLPDTSKVIRVALDRSYGNKPPVNPALVFGDAPWSKGNERLSGVLRGIQLYSDALSAKEIIREADSALSTAAGAANVWYLNLNPTPGDISDKSGKNHHPAWAGSARAKAWTGP